MPTLNWIGKKAVIIHHKEVPFRLLEPEQIFSCEADNGNLIVQGDNLQALKSLLPRYAGKVKCIYIDPPYNTGNEGWAYNDNVNSPEIQKWLGEVVGKEGETLDRHDRWLCMMYPRLLLLKQFLREDGAIFVSIDDNELACLRLLMDEIWGKRNFIETIIWEKNYAPKASAKFFSESHEYIITYAKNSSSWIRNLMPRSDKQDKIYKNPDNDSRGRWRPNNLAARNYYSKGIYPIKCPSGRIITGPPKGSYWRISEEKFKELDQDNRIWWGKDGNNVPAPKIFLSEVTQGVVPMSLWQYSEVGHTQEAKKELLELVDFETSDEVFITPKPTRLIQRILQIATDKDSLVLDSFAGSGTTAHAVLKQNAEDGGNRRFILVEMDQNIAQNVTAERIKHVVQGYTNAKGQDIAGLGSGFQYCRLSSEPLFQADGAIRPDVTFAQLAEFVWFMETGSGQHAVDPQKQKKSSPLLGIHQDRAIFLLYNGILKDKTDKGGNVLNYMTLEILKAELLGHEGSWVVYGAFTRFSKTKLAQLGITFHQLPYDLAVKTWL
ncbi:Modification methylase MboII [Saezia sanguinis]|uniref:site-specific DNA-methyltransferase (adenine-specific) n=1 Tax=Saezia sanguinis TaxID=1965230 RepID=A0A433SH86_9BURK|nr:site-specific DNA-methyltransferase [Saezia sanguinis]RUS68103.1 Modification methylase MboII [Saezia sanguinis]